MASTTRLLFTVLTALYFVSPSQSASGSSDWGYSASDGPSTWGERYQFCKEKKQSPINIVPSQTQMSTKYSNLSLNAPSVISTMLKNTGSSLTATLDSQSTLILTGGPLQQRQFRVAQFHIHFSVNGKGGSEHQIDKHHTAAELHVVTYDMAYGNLSAAVGQEGGLAVIGVMLERVEGNVTSTPDDLTKFLSESASLKFNGNEKPLSVNLPTMFPSDWASSFYFYDGSLTTPPCGEVVNWLLCRSTIKVSADDIDALSDVHIGTDASSAQMSGNYRPPQPIGSRTIYYTGPTISGAAAKGLAGFLFYSTLTFVMVVSALFF